MVSFFFFRFSNRTRSVPIPDTMEHNAPVPGTRYLRDQCSFLYHCVAFFKNIFSVASAAFFKSKKAAPGCAQVEIRHSITSFVCVFAETGYWCRARSTCKNHSVAFYRTPNQAILFCCACFEKKCSVDGGKVSVAIYYRARIARWLIRWLIKNYHWWKLKKKSTFFTQSKRVERMWSE